MGPRHNVANVDHGKLYLQNILGNIQKRLGSSRFRHERLEAIQLSKITILPRNLADQLRDASTWE